MSVNQSRIWLSDLFWSVFIADPRESSQPSFHSETCSAMGRALSMISHGIPVSGDRMRDKTYGTLKCKDRGIQ